MCFKQLLIFFLFLTVSQCDKKETSSKAHLYKAEGHISGNNEEVAKKNSYSTIKSAAIVQVPKSTEVVSEQGGESLNSKVHSSLELNEKLKKIRNDDVTLPENIEKIKKRFKKYQEIKDELNELNLFPRTDSEIMKELIENCKQIKKDEELLPIIEDFDYLVHQYDNAQEFVNLNGFKIVIYQNLNSSNPKIRAEILKLLGSAMQHNAKVQIHALETDAINILLKILAIDTVYSVRMRAVFALSSLLRKFPLAQLKYIENGGLNVFSTLFDKPEDIKIQLKIISLLYDLLTEHSLTINDTTISNYTEKSKQYMLINLKGRLRNGSWCQKVENVLRNILVVDESDHDSIQRCLELMKSMSEICGSSYDENTFYMIRKLRDVYQNLILFDNSDDFATEYYLFMRTLCDDVIKNIRIKIPKSEL